MTKLGYVVMVIVIVGITLLWLPSPQGIIQGIPLSEAFPPGKLIIGIPVTVFILAGTAYSLNIFKRKEKKNEDMET